MDFTLGLGFLHNWTVSTCACVIPGLTKAKGGMRYISGWHSLGLSLPTALGVRYVFFWIISFVFSYDSRFHELRPDEGFSLGTRRSLGI